MKSLKKLSDPFMLSTTLQLCVVCAHISSTICLALLSLNISNAFYTHIEFSLKPTSFQRHKWPQTKMHTNFDIIFGHSALSHGVIYFVPRVSSKNLEMEVSDWLLKNFNQ